MIDEDRNLSFVNFGEISESHHQAVEFVRGYCEVPVSRRFRTVVTSGSGYPLDKHVLPNRQRAWSVPSTSWNPAAT